MKEVLFVIGLAVGFALLVNTRKSEEMLWELQLEASNQAGEEWEASQNISKESLTPTQKLPDTKPE